MDFKLTKTQELTLKMVREFSQKEIEPVASKIDDEEFFPQDIISKLAKLNLLGLVVPAQYGGAGIDSITYSIIIEELSKSSATVGAILNAHSTALYLIYQAGSDNIRNKYLKDLATGAKIGAFAFTEPHAGTDTSMLETTARFEDNIYILNGNKIYVTNGDVADIFVVAARYDNKPALFIVEKEYDGFSKGSVQTTLGLRGSAPVPLYFEDCRVPVENKLTDDGIKHINASLNLHKIGVCSQAIGVVTAALNASIEYANNRIQFGVPISRFQAIQWMIADIKVGLETARLILYKSAFMKDNGEDYTLSISEATALCAELVTKATFNALQIHGGIGYMREYPIERYYRDAKTIEIYCGTADIQKKYIAEKILGILT